MILRPPEDLLCDPFQYAISPTPIARPTHCLGAADNQIPYRLSKAANSTLRLPDNQWSSSVRPRSDSKLRRYKSRSVRVRALRLKRYSTLCFALLLHRPLQQSRTPSIERRSYHACFSLHPRSRRVFLRHIRRSLSSSRQSTREAERRAPQEDAQAIQAQAR